MAPVESDAARPAISPVTGRRAASPGPRFARSARHFAVSAPRAKTVEKSMELIDLARIRLPRHDHEVTRPQYRGIETRESVGNQGVAGQVQVEETGGVRAVEEVVRLVDDDPVRKPGLSPQAREGREGGAHVVELLGVRDAREIDDDAHVGIAKRGDQLMRLRRRVLTSEDPDAGQRLQGPVVAFGIENAHGVTRLDELLRQQPGDPRLPRAWISADQEVSSPETQVDRTTVRRRSQEDLAAAGPRDTAAGRFA